jgi:hypothetical protein
MYDTFNKGSREMCIYIYIFIYIYISFEQLEERKVKTKSSVLSFFFFFLDDLRTNSRAAKRFDLSSTGNCV